jgi:subtilisin family serine protease
MKKLFTLFLLGLNSVVFAQNYVVQMQSGSFLPSERSFVTEVSSSEIVNHHYYRVIQFYYIPTDQQKAAIEAQGVGLYNYLPNNCFMASIPTGISLSNINKDGNIRSIFPFEQQYKLSVDLAQKKYPSYALKGAGKIELYVLHHPGITTEEVAQSLRDKGVEVLFTLQDQQGLRVITKTTDITKLAALPYIYFIEPADTNPQAENLVGRTDHRSNTIATDYSGGLKYDGTGVSVALNDDGVIGPHIDYTGRIINQYISFNNGNHGDHCAGTIFGGGNIDPTTRGMAFGADLGVYGVSGSFANTYQAFDSIYNHYNTEKIRITSTSYGDGNNTGYTSRARLMDLQINTMPELIHVFSAGNSGTSDYSYGAGAGWGNVTGGHKQAKNVVTVGNLTSTDALASSSSRGPARDGRIKPDICAVGTNVNSTMNPHSYQSLTGTSMACPGVAGTLAQLYQAYRNLHGDTTPVSSLIKAVALNTADDLGNPGPDYRFGYGRINARRAYGILQSNQHFFDTVSQGGLKTRTINVPAGTAELRVMVYWHDKEATAGVAKALVNNLDMTITTPSAQTVLPWVLNRTPTVAALNANAFQGKDTLNNMEQVTITNPSTGAYTVNVSGFAVPSGPQRYVVVYEFVKDEITVTYPLGGESVVPGVAEIIRWDAVGTTGNFTVQYSVDNGTTWTNISTLISGASRFVNWTPPSTVTGRARVRVSRGSLSDVSDTTFSIIGIPSSLTLNWVCTDSFKVSYNAVTGATGYIVTVLGNTYMDSAASSSTTSCVVKGINTTLPGWYSVQAIGPNGCIGRRAFAQQRPILPFNCVIPDDLGVVSYSAPVDSSVFSCQFTSVTEQVSIQIKNNGLTALNNTVAKYTVNGGAPVIENVNGPIPGQTTITHTFAQPAAFSAPGIYTIKMWIENPADFTLANDTIEMIKHIIQPTPQSVPFTEDFESFTICDTSSNCSIGECLLSSGWTNERNAVDDDIDWRITSGPTPTSSATGTTGPTMDLNPGTATGQYAYLEATNCFNKTANLVSPCLDLTSLVTPVLTFGYHMFGSGMGSLHVDALVNGQWQMDITTVVSGNQGNSWHTATVPLIAYAQQTISLRIRGVTGTNEESDIAIDDIRVSEPLSVTENNLNHLQLLPNPSKGIFYLQMPDGTAAGLRVTDLTGRVVLEGGVSKPTTILDLQNQPSGVYIVTVKNNSGVVVRKIVTQ